jgi:hypothetical protein
MREAQRCDELYILAKQRIISNLRQQPEFILQPKFELRGKKFRAIIYRADFSYFDNEKQKYVVEDVKGSKKILTQAYILKKKMLLFTMRDREDFLFIEYL